MSVSIGGTLRIVLYNRLLPILSAALAGALMAVQGTLNSLFGKSIGLVRTTFLVQILGGAAAALLLLAPASEPGFARLGQAPWYAWLGGPIGVAIVFFVASSIGRIGAGLATTSIIIAQLTTACLLDHFGLLGVERLPFTALKGLGIALVAVGGWILLR